MSEMNKVEEILNEIKENLSVENKVSTEIAKSADNLVTVQVEQFEKLSKSVSDLSEKLDSIMSVVNSLNIPTQEQIEKSINDKAEELAKSVEEKTEALNKKVEDLENEPVVKSATVVVEDKVEEEVIETPALSRQDLINKALAELPEADINRKAQLFKAISRLEAGVSIDKVNF